MNELDWRLLEDRTPLASIEVDGESVTRGSHVRLRPRKGGDILDLVLAGQVAIVESLEEDYEGRRHVARSSRGRSGARLGNAPSAGTSLLLFAGGNRSLAGQPGGANRFGGTHMTRSGILVAGIGNIFLGDDAFGVEVVREAGGAAVSAGRA